MAIFSRFDQFVHVMADLPSFSHQPHFVFRHIAFHMVPFPPHSPISHGRRDMPYAILRYAIIEPMSGRCRIFRRFVLHENLREMRMEQVTNDRQADSHANDNATDDQRDQPHENVNKLFSEPTLSSKPIFEGKVISLRVEEVRLPNGETATREIVKHPGAVAVLPLIGDRMLVVEQYRKALERSLVEIPAGKLEPGEDPLEAAKRELAEETGYRCGKIGHIASFYTSPGFADELMHLYVATELKPGDMRPDDDEFLQCRAITLDEAKRYIAEQRIRDAKTIAAVYAWQMFELTGSFQP